MKKREISKRISAENTSKIHTGKEKKKKKACVVRYPSKDNNLIFI